MVRYHRRFAVSRTDQGDNMKKESKASRYIIPAAIFACGVAFVIIGIADKEVLTVLRKAAAICMECIGLG